ncbi:hypothetical protein [Microbacterium sp. NPDC079995]|uniref:hypothetical protein n=1 Tax=unclassified Microbacterium TaxID=2609290 RepID=UPI00344B13DE
MTQGDVETFWQAGSWRNRIEGGEVMNGEYPVRSIAVAVGCAIALSRHVAHVVFDENGAAIHRDDFRRFEE